MRTRRPPLALIAVLFSCASTLASGCFGGGGGGGNSTSVELEVEPNTGVINANKIKLGQPIKGDVIETDDEDWFQLKLKANQTIQIELFATRLDQQTWDTAINVPRLTIFFPDDVTKLLEQSLETGWPFGSLDFDIPTFTVPQNGTYWFVIRGDGDMIPGGRYVLRISDLKPPPKQEEIEAPLDLGVNDSPGTAQVIQNGSLTGTHREGNDDYYKVQVNGPRVIRAEILAQRNGAYKDSLSAYDPVLRILDVDGSTVLAEDDDAFYGDAGVQEYVVAAGTYYVQVTQSATSTEGAPYVLQFSSDPANATAEVEPNNTSAAASPLAYGGAADGNIALGEVDWYRFDGDPGDMVRLQVFDVANSTVAIEAVDVALFGPDGTTPLTFSEGPEFQVLSTILQQNGPFFARVLPGATATLSTQYRLELTRFQKSVQESEPNDSLAAANPFPNSDLAAGAISIPGDVDLFRFTAKKDELVTFAIFAANLPSGSFGSPEYSGWGSDLLPLLTIRDSVGGVVATSTSAPVNGVYTESVLENLPTGAVTFVVPPTDSTYYLEVASTDGSGSSSHDYVVQRL